MLWNSFAPIARLSSDLSGVRLSVLIGAALDCVDTIRARKNLPLPRAAIGRMRRASDEVHQRAALGTDWSFVRSE
jgi:hypothetical protein